jgi:hypothetical protein
MSVANGERRRSHQLGALKTAVTQALVKVRGDGLEFDMGRAEMQMLPAPGAGATGARLKIDGTEQPRWVRALHEWHVLADETTGGCNAAH